jgi:hypothetical protein
LPYEFHTFFLESERLFISLENKLAIRQFSARWQNLLDCFIIGHTIFEEP